MVVRSMRTLIRLPLMAALSSAMRASGFATARPLVSARRISSAPAMILRGRHVLPTAAPISRVPLVRLLATEPDRTVVDVCTKKITDAISPSKLEVTGAYDDPNGSHISIYAVSEKFEGKRSLARQQMVFKAIWEEMQGACMRRAGISACQPRTTRMHASLTSDATCRYQQVLCTLLIPWFLRLLLSSKPAGAELHRK